MFQDLIFCCHAYFISYLSLLYNLEAAKHEIETVENCPYYSLQCCCVQRAYITARLHLSCTWATTCHTPRDPKDRAKWRKPYFKTLRQAFEKRIDKVETKRKNGQSEKI